MNLKRQAANICIADDPLSACLLSLCAYFDKTDYHGAQEFYHTEQAKKLMLKHHCISNDCFKKVCACVDDLIQRSAKNKNRDYATLARLYKAENILRVMHRLVTLDNQQQQQLLHCLKNCCKQLNQPEEIPSGEMRQIAKTIAKTPRRRAV